jgi:hypothetical protein
MSVNVPFDDCQYPHGNWLSSQKGNARQHQRPIGIQEPLEQIKDIFNYILLQRVLQFRVLLKSFALFMGLRRLLLPNEQDVTALIASESSPGIGSMQATGLADDIWKYGISVRFAKFADLSVVAGGDTPDKNPWF